MGFVAAAVGASAVAGVAGSLISGNAAKSAASTQAAAALQAAQLQANQQNQTRADLLPYNTAGQFALGTLDNQLGYLTSPTDTSTANLENLPGYQFERSQGLESTQNAAAARGLGVSGAALKGAANFATGLADSNWQNYFNADQTTKTNAYNKLIGVVNTGENAAAQTGNLGQLSAANQGNNLTSAANAQAAGTVGSANALTSGLSGVGGSAMNYLIMSKLLGGDASAAATDAIGNGTFV